MTPMSVATPDPSNVAVPSVTFSRQSFSGQERVTVTAGIANRGATPQDVAVSLDVEGRPIQTQQTHIAPNAASSVTFTQFTLDKPIVKGTVRAGTDQLPADNTFHFTVAPSAPVSLLVVEGGDPDRRVSVESPGRQLVARVPDGTDAGRPRLAEQLREARRRDPQRRRVSTRARRMAR